MRCKAYPALLNRLQARSVVQTYSPRSYSRMIARSMLFACVVSRRSGGAWFSYPNVNWDY